MAFRSQNAHPPIKPHESDPPSSNLWVGNLAGEVTESDLMNLFQKQGEIDNITLYSARSYAFVHFKRIEEAIAARNSLQGIVLCGNALKIEFTKPVLDFPCCFFLLLFCEFDDLYFYYMYMYNMMGFWDISICKIFREIEKSSNSRDM